MVDESEGDEEDATEINDVRKRVSEWCSSYWKGHKLNELVYKTYGFASPSSQQQPQLENRQNTMHRQQITIRRSYEFIYGYNREMRHCFPPQKGKKRTEIIVLVAMVVGRCHDFYSSSAVHLFNRY